MKAVTASTGSRQRHAAAATVRLRRRPSKV